MLTEGAQRIKNMPGAGCLLAWIEDKGDQKFTAYLISSDLEDLRLPFTFVCLSRLKAQLWIESQAEAIRLPVDWISGPY